MKVFVFFLNFRHDNVDNIENLFCLYTWYPWFWEGPINQGNKIYKYLNFFWEFYDSQKLDSLGSGSPGRKYGSASKSCSWSVFCASGTILNTYEPLPHTINSLS